MWHSQSQRLFQLSMKPPPNHPKGFWTGVHWGEWGCAVIWGAAASLLKPVPDASIVAFPPRSSL